jgi:hypothetical protein
VSVIRVLVAASVDPGHIVIAFVPDSTVVNEIAKPRKLSSTSFLDDSLNNLFHGHAMRIVQILVDIPSTNFVLRVAVFPFGISGQVRIVARS